VLRERGAYEIFREEIKKSNVYFIGAGSDLVDGYAYAFINKEAKKPEDLAGLQVATGGFFSPMLDAWEMTGIMVPPVERYTAVERGVADGTIISAYYASEISLFEVADFWVDHGVLGSVEQIVVNLDKWNSLPAHLQQLLIDVQAELDAGVAADIADETLSKSKKILADGGMKPIHFSEVDGKRYLDKIFEGMREGHFEKYPDWAPKMYELLQ
jgi:TRAP-type C4-dicarboxylate transport system substrate-binding protein